MNRPLLALAVGVLVLSGCGPEQAERWEALYAGFEEDGQANEFALNRDQWIAQCEESDFA